MSAFDFWQRWGIDLDDTTFANAWAALGVAAAARRRQRVTPIERLGEVFEAAQAEGGLMPWTFPDPGSARREPVLVRGTTPYHWAAAWNQQVKTENDRDPVNPKGPRLRIAGAPADEGARPWWHLLGESRPASNAVSFALDAPRAQLQMGWPLRFGYHGDEASAALIEAARENWPANDLSRVVPLGRSAANCDVLVHRGTVRELLRVLLECRTPSKANIVLLRDDAGAPWGEISTLLATVLAEVRASAYVIVPESYPEEGLAQSLNGLVAELSHALSLDVAIARSFGHAHRQGGSTHTGVIAGYTDALLEFRLPELGETYTRRMRAMPKGAEVDLSALGNPDEWGAHGVSTRTAAAPPPALDAFETRTPSRRVAARDVAIDTGSMFFNAESGGGSSLAAVSGALEEAAIPPRAQEQRAARYLQQRAFVRHGGKFEPAAHGFVNGLPALVRVRIGPSDREWNALPTSFPTEALPQHLEQWTLTVWLTEPDHLEAPLKDHIKLPRDGASTECEFRFKPGAHPRFEGRLTVMHHGRVIQTAVLRAAVCSTYDAGTSAGAPQLEELIPVHHALGELGKRRQFDIAFVLNHSAAGRPLAAGLSERHAWLADLSKCEPITKDINNCLSRVAKSVVDYAEGLDGEEGRKLLVQLAQLGRYLHLYIVEEQLNATGNRPDVASEEYLQIVSTRSDAVIPFEFIYDYETPDDKADVCPRWRQALRNGECVANCDRDSGGFVCPLGFWGLRKVIERHALTPELAREGHQLYLQSELASASGSLRLGGVGIYGASQRVSHEGLDRLATELSERTGKAPYHASDWQAWITAVHDNHPTLLIALAHTDGNGANVSLELGGNTIKSIQIKKRHVRATDDDPQPIVALLGCDTAGTADDYGQHVAIFRARGAAIVIGTIATVFGEHAAQVACRLVDGLLPAGGGEPQRLGETLRALKRTALLDNLLMPLCLVAYGDADWKLSKE
jgi:hypothetical protein